MIRKSPHDPDYGSNFTTCIGIVKNNADLAQHGRLQVYIPSIDSSDYDLEDLPWANYVTPFGGSTANFKVGREQNEVPGMSTYGFWAIPKIGAQVLCGFLEGDPQVRFWMGCIYQPELNRTLPNSIDPIMTELDQTGSYPSKEIPYLRKNLKEAGLEPGTLHYKTRGGYERSVSHPSNRNKVKPAGNGYHPKPLDPSKSDSQMICLTSPGRHYFLMSDVDEYCRIRIKTTEGNQIIFDDTNERIYISTARGRNWIELDEGSGKIYLYSDSKINIRSKNDINLCSDENINIVAKKRVNIESETRGVHIQGKMSIDLLSTDSNLKLTASRDVHIKTTNGPKTGGVSGKSSCNVPPNVPSGVITDFTEESGSSTSRIIMEGAEGVDVTAATESIYFTAASNISSRAISGSVTLHAGTTVNFKGTEIMTSAGACGMEAIDPDGSIDPVVSSNNFSGSAPIARRPSSVTKIDTRSKMIVPEHESWTRDEDESLCPTPRNKKYQG